MSFFTPYMFFRSIYEKPQSFSDHNTDYLIYLRLHNISRHTYLHLSFVCVAGCSVRSATSVVSVLAKMIMWWERKLRSITWSVFVVAPAWGGSRLATSSPWGRTASSVGTITMSSKAESTAPEPLVYPEARITITPRWRTTITICTRTTARCQVGARSYVEDQTLFFFFARNTLDTFQIAKI